MIKFLFGLACILLGSFSHAQRTTDRDSSEHYYNTGQYAKGLPYAIRSYERSLLKKNTDTSYIAAAYTLGSIYFGLAKYDSATVYYRIAADEAKIAAGSNSQLYGRYLVDVATMQREAGRFKEARSLYQEAIAILEPIETAFKNDYAFSLIQYARLRFLLGEYGKAEELLLQAKNIAPRNPIEKRTEYALSMHELGLLYQKMGNYEKQETIQVQVLEMLKEMFGEQHPAYSSAINNLAILYHQKRKYVQADSMYRKALEIKKKANGANPMSYLMMMQNVGIVNTEMKNYAIAEAHLNEAVDVAYKNGGEETLHYPFCLNNLARLYAWTNRVKEAEALFRKSLSIYNKLGVSYNSSRLKQLYDMARLVYTDDSSKAFSCLQEAIELENQLLLNNLEFMSETELLIYLKGIEVAAAKPYMFLMNYNYSDMAGIAYNSKLLHRGIALNNTKALYENMEKSDDAELAPLWKNYLQQKKTYTNLLITPLNRRTANADSIAIQVNDLEKELLKNSADYRNMKNTLSISWKDIRNNLNAGETAIEFVRFAYRFNTYLTGDPDTVYYAALLIRAQDTAPVFVPLFEEKELLMALKKYAYKGNALTRSREELKAIQLSGLTIYNLLWKPLEKYLQPGASVFYTPDGLLHRLSFAAIPYAKDKFLCDRYKLVQLTSTQQITQQRKADLTNSSIALFGGIHYSINSNNQQVRPTVLRAEADSFYYLPHTLMEVNTISERSEKLRRMYQLFTADQATEHTFKQLSGRISPDIIHIATHGFTYSTPTSTNSSGGELFKSADNPLLRCGLVMAGGNTGWMGRNDPDVEDGILTGLEISNVQLPNTKLAVLSACETGLGKIEGSEGVFGLQRAFKLAGVDYILASLWQVPDKETAQYMDTFYSNLLEGKSIREAFFVTQQYMRKRYAPYYWAGFTLVQ
jgi:CHAT domain-containing protein/tetratricopeptide (TPR) repeat protein